MRIAITLISGLGYGALTYANNLIPALAKIDKINEYHIFTQGDNPFFKTIKQHNFIFHKIPLNIKSTLLRHIWEQFFLPFKIKRMKADIIFTAKNGNILLAPCKTIISIRNMEPLCFNRYKNDWKLNIFSWLRKQHTKISIIKAKRVIAVSENTKNFLNKEFPGINDKIDVVYNGNSIINYQAKMLRGDGEKTFLLSSSKFVTYANQLNLIQAYKSLSDKKNGELPPLYIAGGILDMGYFKKIKEYILDNGLKEKIKILGLLTHESLVELYPKAIAFIFPSTLEACPQTLIEAMASGLPIAASNVLPMPEICEKGAIYFDPLDKNDITEKIQLLIENGDLREKLRKAALERSSFFNWDKTASEILKIFYKSLS